MSLGLWRAVSPVGLSVAQRCAQLAEQTAAMAMSGVDQVAEVTKLACGVVEAAIAEATSVHNHVESRVSSLTKRLRRRRHAPLGQ